MPDDIEIIEDTETQDDIADALGVSPQRLQQLHERNEDI